MPSATEIYTIEMKVKGDAAIKQLQRSTNQLNATAKRTQQNVSKMSKQMDVAAVATKRFAVAAAAAAAVQLVRTGLDQADAIAKSAKAADLAAETYQQYAFAAEQAGVTQEKFSKSMITFQKSTQDAADGLQDQARAFDRLGVSFRDAGGNVKKTEEVFEDVVAALAKMEAGAAKTRTAATLLGRAGPALAASMNNLEGGFQATAASAEALATVIGSEVLKDAERINDEFNALARLLRAQLMPLFVSATQVALDLANTWNELSDQVGPVVKDFVNLISEGKRLVDGLRLIDAGVISTTEGFEKLGKVLTVETRGGLLGSMKELAAYFGIELPKSMNIAVDDILRAYARWTGQQAIAEDFIIDSFEKLTGSVTTYIAELKKIPPATTIWKNELTAVDAAMTNVLKKSDSIGYAEKVKAAADAAAAFNKIQDDTIQSILRIEAEEKRIAAQRARWIEEQTELQRQAAEEIEAVYIDLGEKMGDVFGNMAGDIIAGTKSAKAAFKTFVQDMVKLLAKLVAEYLALYAVQVLTGTNTGSSSALGSLLSASSSVPSGLNVSTMAAQQTSVPVVGVRQTSINPASLAAIGGGGTEVTVNNNMPGAQVDVSEDKKGNAVITISEVRKAVASDIQRGGNEIARAMEGAYRVNRAGSAY